MNDNRLRVTRRRVLQAGSRGLLGLGAAFLTGCGADRDEAIDFDGELEVTSLRLSKPPPVCVVAQYVAEEYLYAEGFQEIDYIPLDDVGRVGPSTSAGIVDFAMNFAAPIAVSIDRGDNLSVLAGMHVGCFDLFATDRISQANDLKGGRIAVSKIGADAADYSFIAGIFQWVGIDVNRDVTFVEGSPQESKMRLASGEVDGFLTFPPFTQGLRDEGIGHVILSSVEDPPWSQYFCCLVTGNKRFIRNNPSATRRVVRAYVKAAEHCASQPEAVADFLVEKEYMDNRAYAGEMMRTLPYDVWQRFNPDDTLRFYALRLREAGVIGSTPDEIIENGTDWRFIDSLEPELAFAPGTKFDRSAFFCDLSQGQARRRFLPVQDPRQRDS